jgi:hypothetical protein
MFISSVYISFDTHSQQDTTTFIRAKDVMSIYHQVAKEVNKLNDVRDRQGQEGMISGSSAIATDTPSALPSSSRRGSLTGKVASNLRETYTPGVDGSDKGKELGDNARPGLGLDGRTVSIDSTASSSTAKQSVDSTDDDEDDEDGLVSGESSRNASAMSTPYEERGINFDKFSKRFPSARESPALSPTIDEEAFTSAGDPKTPRLSQQHMDAPEEDALVDEVSAQMEQQHISQIDVKPPSETNRVDQVLNDVFGLLSLFFLTIGKTKESPGTYCQIASMRVGHSSSLTLNRWN